MKIHFECDATKKKDCHLWVTLSKKKRCGDCSVYRRKAFDECCSCPEQRIRCKYEIDKHNTYGCSSSVAKVHAMLEGLKKLGVEVEIK